jgi:peroxin-1
MCLIKVSEALAECIGLKDGARVLVRAKVEVAKAKMVTIEPASEDDWEILELNADYLEQHLLARVGVLREGQRFPVWVESGTVLVLLAVSTQPKSLVCTFVTSKPIVFLCPNCVCHFVFL